MRIHLQPGSLLSLTGLTIGLLLITGSLAWLWDLANWLSANKAYTFCIHFYAWCLSEPDHWSLLYDVASAGNIVGLLLVMFSSFWAGRVEGERIFYRQATSSISVPACIRCGKEAVGCNAHDGCFLEKYCKGCLRQLLVHAT